MVYFLNFIFLFSCWVYIEFSRVNKSYLSDTIKMYVSYRSLRCWQGVTMFCKKVKWYGTVYRNIHYCINDQYICKQQHWMYFLKIRAKRFFQMLHYENYSLPIVYTVYSALFYVYALHYVNSLHNFLKDGDIFQVQDITKIVWLFELIIYFYNTSLSTNH